MRDEQALHDILEHSQLIPLFQPILSFAENRIYGYEALIRGPAESPLHTPAMLFDDAARATPTAMPGDLSRDAYPD
ncbi:MAG: hypothetical protein O2845_06420 [Proteobacteria bacterium]|nr:hypothetical protein [Pseudomonadota bacterium]